ncbi:transcriptional regulator with XRE-family HTH domain [Elusimicrobium simillimum]|uniref:helix-turn-helix domain-containing protein n=1 Tax=Elusimicrobium simillimum TaxID=3143438 RepID=UPI003C6FAC7B
MNIGDKIRKARNELNLTQRQLADLAKIAQPTLAKWEANKGGISKKNIEKLAKALGKDYKYFYEDNTSENKSNVNPINVKLTSRLWGL